MELGEIYGWDVCTNNVPMLVHTERRAGESVRFSEREARGSYKMEKSYFETDIQAAHFWVAKSGSSFLGL
jgi:hypothetical protein